MNARGGWFVTFEGIEGVGKSTQVSRAGAVLAATGVEVVTTREPGGTPLAEQLRALVLGRAGEPVTPAAELLIMYAARAQHTANLIRPALERGAFVLCDRYGDASYAYQGGGRGFDWDVLSQLEHWVQQGDTTLLQPELTVWFDLPPAVAAERLEKARVPDRFESQSRSFFENVAAGYARRFAVQPQRFVRINADQTPAEVWSALHTALQQKGYLP